jgi:hypothetical protein
MENINNLNSDERPPNHEKVSEDLLIYALPNWVCPELGKEQGTQQSEGSGNLLALHAVILVTIVAVWLVA